MKNLVIIITLLTANLLISQNCNPLSNGRYKLIPNKKFAIYPEYIFKIKNNKLISINLKTGKRNRFKIRTNDHCTLSFASTKTENENPNELEITKILKRQKSYYTIDQIGENEYTFVDRVDLHVMIYDGKMIKQ